MPGSGNRRLDTGIRERLSFLVSSFKTLTSCDRGVALMVVMVLSVVALAIMASLLYMLSVGTGVSGGMKRYETAQEAADGGKEVVFDWIGLHSGAEFPEFGSTIINGTTTSCLEDKLAKATKNWASSCSASTEVDITDPNSYDFRFDLGDYRVYAKIVNTVEGNTGPSSTVLGLAKTGVVRANTGEVPVKQIPYLYTIVVEARNKNYDPNQDLYEERAKLSILYRY